MNPDGWDLDRLPRPLRERFEELYTMPSLPRVDRNMGIDHDQTDRGAAVVLREIADMIRSVVGEARRGR